MRISTNLMTMFALESMLRQQSEMSITQLQITTGNKILAPSDDPYGSSRALNLDENTKINTQYSLNAEYAETRLTTAESALDGVSIAIQRVRELAVYGNNDANNFESRASIAEEVKKVLEQIMDLGNTMDSNKEYLFSGYQGRTKPFTVDNALGFTYSGDDGNRALKIGTSTHVDVSDPGDEIFMKVKNGNGDFQVSENAANTGTGIIDPGSVIGNYVPDTFRVRFLDFPSLQQDVPPQYYIVNSANEVVVCSINGASVYWDAGLGAYTPDGVTALPDPLMLDNPPAPGSFSNTSVLGGVYAGIPVEQGEQLFGMDNFGVNTSITGQPIGFQYASVATPPAPPYTFVGGSVSDEFTIEPSENQNLFQTVQNLVDALLSPQKQQSDLAHLHNAVNRVLADVDQNLARIINVRAKIGARLNVTGQQKQINESFNLQMKTVLSGIRDLDYAEAITRLNQQLLSLQASQQTYQKIQSLSLFNYL